MGESGQTITYFYDTKSNILNKKIYAYTTSVILGSPTEVKNYPYEDSEWGDLLTNYNSEFLITYDTTGKLLSYNSYI